jgi:hypothetical protein
MSTPGIFGELAPLYRAKGFWPRPIKLGSKQTFVKRWTRPDHEFEPQELMDWLREHKGSGIGLLMGSPLPDGTVLGAIDVDRDEYRPLAEALLGDTVSGRFGSKGLVVFVRVAGVGKSRTFSVKGEAGKKWGQVAEALFVKRLCVIPPTIHPTTNAPYTWIGAPLLDVDFRNLPLIET